MSSSNSGQNIVLAIDMGTSGPKVCLVNERGELLAQEFQPTELILLPGGGQEQRPDDWWGAIEDAAQRLLARQVVPTEDIKSIAVTTQWSGTVAVDKEGHPLMNAVGWMDTRGAKHIAKITAGFPQVERYALGRAMQWIRLTGGAPGHSGKDSLAHILWMKHDAPSIYQQAYKFLEPKDWVNLKLTGRFAASYDSIALYWATDNRDINRVDYHPKLLEMAGLDREKLPDLKKSTDVLGTISFDIARDWGLSPEVEVVMGTPDVHSAAVGSGGVRDFDPHIYVGTSSWLTCHVPFKKTDLFNNMASLPSAIPGRYLVLNEQEAAGSCMTWLRDQVFFPDDSLRQSDPPQEAYAAFDALAETASPGSGKMIFAPWLVGERTPIEDHNVRGGWFNMSLSTTRAEMVRSVLEGVALNSRWLLVALEKFCKRRFDSLRMIGGGAKSATWCQIYADVLGRPIKQMSDPLAAGARGAACLALVGSGKLDFESFGASVKVEKTYEPRREHRQIYDELFTEFRQLYKANKAAYERLNRH
jgi:xylulokinase